MRSNPKSDPNTPIKKFSETSLLIGGVIGFRIDTAYEWLALG